MSKGFYVSAERVKDRRSTTIRNAETFPHNMFLCHRLSRCPYNLPIYFFKIRPHLRGKNSLYKTPQYPRISQILICHWAENDDRPCATVVYLLVLLHSLEEDKSFFCQFFSTIFTINISSILSILKRIFQHRNLEVFQFLARI